MKEDRQVGGVCDRVSMPPCALKRVGSGLQMTCYDNASMSFPLAFISFRSMDPVVIVNNGQPFSRGRVYDPSLAKDSPLMSLLVVRYYR